MAKWVCARLCPFRESSNSSQCARSSGARIGTRSARCFAAPPMHRRCSRALFFARRQLSPLTHNTEFLSGQTRTLRTSLSLSRPTTIIHLPSLFFVLGAAKRNREQFVGWPAPYKNTSLPRAPTAARAAQELAHLRRSGRQRATHFLSPLFFPCKYLMTNLGRRQRPQRWPTVRQRNDHLSGAISSTAPPCLPSLTRCRLPACWPRSPLAVRAADGRPQERA